MMFQAESPLKLKQTFNINFLLTGSVPFHILSPELRARTCSRMSLFGATDQGTL